MKKLLAAVAAIIASACADVSSPTGSQLTRAEVPFAASQAEPRPGHHIVVFRDGVTDVDGIAAGMVAAHSGRLEHTYHNALKGFAAELSDSAVAVLRQHPDVAMIEPDGIMSIVVTQTNATWGIDRVDQRDLPLSTTYDYTTTGSGVNVYIIDTGIRTTHTELAGRAFSAFDAIGDGNGSTDCNGHGTHVSGTVAGTTYGVAKQARVYSVRVLGCGGSGSTSGVIAGVDWVTANHVKPAVANMSLGGGISSTLDQAVRNSVTAGVTYAIAAGNSNFDACNGSPSRVLEALVVGATTTTDARSSFSNFGTCLDIFAPGSGITSAWNGSDTQTNTISGTSMAAPHVAGAAARYLEANPTASPASVGSALTSNASTGKVIGPGTGSPNLLLYTAFLDGPTPPPPPPNQPPVASFTWSCNGLTCTYDGSGSTDDNGIVSYVWDIGAPPQPTGVIVSRTYPHAGQRVMSLTVTDAGGLSNTTSQLVTITAGPNQPPVASFTFSCTNLTCNFNSSGSTDDVGIVNRSWTFGDGGTAGNVVSPSRSYAAAGTYSVTLTVTDGGGLSSSQTQQVTVTAPPPPPPPNQAPVARFTWSCQGLTCTYDASTSTDDNGIVNYIWDIGAPPQPTGVIVSRTYPHGGQRMMTLTVVDAQGLTSTTSQLVTIVAP